MQLEIRNAVERDRLVYNGLGFLLGAFTAFLFFRRLSLTLLAVLGPSIAILWTLGVVGGLDFRLNLFINVLTPLILVAGFSDSMHLVFAIRRDILAGMDRLTAARNAVREVAPACLLTAMNAAIALLSFSLAESALIKTFDSATDGRARRSIHSAFDNPLAAPDAAPRESIESRALIYFGSGD